MSKTGRRAKYSDLLEQHSRNGLKYDEQMDIAIVNELSISESISNSDLKRRIEGVLDRTINSRTYSDHLKKMLHENILQKYDTGERGKQAVYYSLTEQAKKQKQLRILRTDPKCNSFRQIYAILFFRAITEAEIYHCDNSNLDQLLSDIHATRKDLAVNYIKKEYYNGNSNIRITNEPENRILPNATVVHYKPISAVYITETITYRKNIRTHYIWEDGNWYNFYIPGISISGLIEKFSDLMQREEEIEEAFILLSKNRIIKPVMEFRNEIRYALTDKEMCDLITDLKLLEDFETDLNHFMLDYYGLPSDKEIEKIKLMTLDNRAIRKFLNKKELYRFEFKSELKRKKGNKEFINLTKKIEEGIEQIRSNYVAIITYIKERHGHALKKYEFLSGIIGTFCPRLF
jgi:hypothetical protein